MRKQGIIFASLCLFFGVSVALADTFPYHESFESGSGRWFSGGGDFDWSWHFGSTGSWETGPNGAHDRTYYMYTEASGSHHPLKTAILEAEFDVSALANPMLSVRYHMYGATMGKLKVQVFTGGAWEAKWFITGQEQDKHDDPWRRQDIDLLEFAGETNLMIRFWVETGNSYTGDVCIDDVWLYDKPDENLDHFVWSTIGDQQINGDPFSVQVEAVNSSGVRLTSFNEAVEFTAWSAGFSEPVRNGDFEDLLNGWAQVNPASGTIMQSPDSIFGSGKALSFKPVEVEDGLQQEITLMGGGIRKLGGFRYF